VANYAKAEGKPRVVFKRTWEKPRSSFLKLNVDATFSVDDMSGAVGAVIRDAHGNFVIASSKFLQNVSSPAMAEAQAMLHGLELANSIGCNALEAESDSIEVITYFSGEVEMWNEATAVYADCITITSMIGKVEYKHCLRETNEVAHLIARNSFISHISCIWVGEPPSLLSKPFWMM
jgi:ribonuclease HI